eukprot:1870575-Amphidinium_carterae.1
MHVALKPELGSRKVTGTGFLGAAWLCISHTWAMKPVADVVAIVVDAGAVVVGVVVVAVAVVAVVAVLVGVIVPVVVVAV